MSIAIWMVCDKCHETLHVVKKDVNEIGDLDLYVEPCDVCIEEAEKKVREFYKEE